MIVVIAARNPGPDRQHEHRARGPYGGSLYGGDPYGSASAPLPPPWARPSPPRKTHYNATIGLIGAIEGTVTWRGALPPPVVTACGTFENPSVRVGPGRAAGGVLVYLEHVDAGRALPSYGQPVRVGGTVAKHGCVLAPALQIPSSSMEPTLHIGDHLFIVKGPLAKPITPGDVLVYTTDDDRDYIKRYLGAPGQTLDESDAGMVVDGKVLPGEVVDANYSYEDGEPGHMEQRGGIEVREHFGARSYLVLRPEHPRHPGPWKVPPGTAFLVGDNRGNSNDSRYNPATPVDRIKGRAVTIWWAVHDGTPAWDRIGAPIE